MAFELYRGPSNVEWDVVVSGTTVTRGNAIVDNDAGYLTNAAADTGFNIVGVATTTVVGDGTLKVSYWPAYADRWFKGDCEGTPTRAQINTVVDLADANTVDEDSTGNSPVFLIKEILDDNGDGTMDRVAGPFVNTQYGAKGL
jgi:hypothetical protein